MSLRARSTVIPPRRRPVQREALQQEQGIALLRSLGATVYRLGVRRRATDHQGTGMSEGLPDVLAFVPVRGVPATRTFVCWEVKAAGGRLRPEQAEFQARCFEAGVAHVTGDLTALMHWLVGAKFLRADQLPASRQPTTRETTALAEETLVGLGDTIASDEETIPACVGTAPSAKDGAR